MEMRRQQRGADALEERQEDQHAEQPSDQDRVADVVDGGADQQGLVVDGHDVDPGRGRLGGVGQDLVELGGDGQGVAAQAAEDGQDHGVGAVGADRHGAVLVGHDDLAQVPHADRLTVLLGHNPLLQLLGIGDHGVGEHLELPGLLVEPPHGLHAVFLAQPIGHVDQREARRDHLLRVDLDDDLADVAALDRDVGNVEDVGDAGPQIVIGVVAEGRRVAPAGDGEGDDGKDRWRLPFDDRARAGGELRADVGHFRSDVIQGLDHVAAGDEIDADFGGPADRAGLHALHAQDHVDRFLDGPGDAHLDVLDGQSGRLHDDHDPGECHLRIDAARHVQHGVRAGQRQKDCDNHDQAEVRPGQREHAPASDRGYMVPGRAVFRG